MGGRLRTTIRSRASEIFGKLWRFDVDCVAEPESPYFNAEGRSARGAEGEGIRDGTQADSVSVSKPARVRSMALSG